MDQHEPGAKLDNGKNRMALCLHGFSRAVIQVGEVTTFGAVKYTPNGWKSVENAEERYLDAAYRHMLASAIEECDPESGLRHLAHAAWNILAVLELTTP